MTQKFDFKQLDKSTSKDFKVNVVQTGSTIHRAELFRRSTFLWWERWEYVADLYTPVRDVENEIKKTEQKLKELKLKKESELESFGARVRTFGNIYENPVNIDGKKPDKFDDQMGSKSKDDKPKTRKESFTLHQVPDPKGNQQNGRKNQGN